VADGSSHLSTGPRKPARAAVASTFRLVSPARYSATAADAAARNQVRDTCLNCSIRLPFVWYVQGSSYTLLLV
jgi:hypothetical protein